MPKTVIVFLVIYADYRHITTYVVGTSLMKKIMRNNNQKEILALEVKKYPLLYNKSDTDYKNKSVD